MVNAEAMPACMTALSEHLESKIRVAVRQSLAMLAA